MLVFARKLGIAGLACVLWMLVLAPAQTPRSALGSKAPAVLVDINRANMDDLMKVPGMTRTWAARIVRFRPYRAKNDLVDRGVVTAEVYQRIKEYIVAHRVE